MSDIIQDAKKLLDGATPAPWVTGGKDKSGNMYIGNPSGDGNLVATSGICDAELIAAAPENTQALAEETWEYAVLVKIGAKWLFLGRGAGGHSFARNAFWFDKKEKAQGYQLIRGETAPTRIVRRRVSPPEVINE